jgi:hypothetical protein
LNSTPSAPIGQRVALHEELDAPGHVHDVGEARLAHHALAHQPSGDTDAARLGVEHFGGVLAVLGVQFARHDVATEIVGESAAVVAQCGELGAALGDQLVFVVAGVVVHVVPHILLAVTGRA